VNIIKFERHSFSFLFFLFFAFVISSCGGSGDDTTTSTAQTGQFVDGPVSGLRYSTTSGTSGVTDASGRFSYSSGDTVFFSVGGVTVGSANGEVFVTPVDLVSGGTAISTEVTNIVRFLMMLDSDTNPNNGLSISANVQATAAGWTDINFNTVILDSDPNVAVIVNDVSVADSRTAALPNETTARDHLTTNLQCAFGAGYRGTWRSVVTPETGNWALLVDPFNGTIYGGAWDNSATPDAAGGFLLIDGQLDTSQVDIFIASGTAGGFADYQGTMTPNGAVSGTWMDTVAPLDNGTFSGNRVVLNLPAGTPGTVYQGVSIGNDGNASSFIFTVNNGNVIGNGLSFADNSTFTISGTVISSALSATATNTASGIVSDVLGTLNPNGTITGTYIDRPATGGTGSGSFNACADFLVGI